jgi:hypothetical protein
MNNDFIEFMSYRQWKAVFDKGGAATSPPIL